MRNMLPYIVRKYLEEKDISQTELAQMAKINPSTISNMLRNEPYPQRIDLVVAEKLQAIIGFDERDLIIRVEEFVPDDTPQKKQRNVRS